MPYATNDALPDAVKSAYPAERCRSVFRRVFNDHDGDEASAFRVAHTAAKSCAGGKGDDVDTIELKAFTPAEFKLDEAGQVEVAFVKFDSVDKDSDYTFPGAFVPGAAPLSAFNHGSWPQKGGLPPTGIGEVSNGDGWGMFSGKFFMDTTHGRDAYHTVRGMGPAQQWSYGYQILEVGDPPAGVKARRGLKSVRAHEISPVWMGAQPLAHTVSLKEASGDLDPPDGPPAGLKLEDESDRVLVAIAQFGERLEDILDLRLKEGRAISSKRLALLQEHMGKLRAQADAIEEMIAAASAAPKAPEAPARAGKALAMQVRLRLAELESSALN